MLLLLSFVLVFYPIKEIRARGRFVENTLPYIITHHIILYKTRQDN
jgi:hypothetical protein